MSKRRFPQFPELPPELQERILTYIISYGSPIFLNRYTQQLSLQRMFQTLCNKNPSPREIKNYLNTFPLSFTSIDSTKTSLIITIFQEYDPPSQDEEMTPNGDSDLPIYRLNQHKVEYIHIEHQEEYIFYSSQKDQIDYSSLPTINIIDSWSMFGIYNKRTNCVNYFTQYAKNNLKNYCRNVYNLQFNSGNPFKLIGLYLYLYLNFYIWHFNKYSTPSPFQFLLTPGDIFDIHSETRQVYTNVTLYNDILRDIPLLYQLLLNEIN